jgi:glycosyltransferase involved in cell wall biosynthesis
MTLTQSRVEQVAVRDLKMPNSHLLRKPNASDPQALNEAKTRILRIAYFTFSYAPFMTGIATGVHSRVKALLQFGHEVFLIHPTADEQFTHVTKSRRMSGLEEFAGNSRFTSKSYPTRPHPLFRAHSEPRSHRHWSDTALLEEYKPDVILVDEATAMAGFTSLGYGGYRRAVGTRYSARYNVPVFALFETDWLYYGTRYLGRWFDILSPPIMRPLTRRFVGKYTCMFFPSRAMQEKYIKSGASPSRYLPFHGVDCSVYTPENKNLDPIPGDNRPTLLFVGRMAVEKSVQQLFRMVQIVRKEIPNVHLVLIGGGPEQKKVATLAQRNADCATFVGEAFGDQLKGWYARADVFVNPSASENFCTTNLEALASGTPLVAASAGGNVEQVEDGRNGFLVPPGNPEAMAAKAVQILKSDSMRREMSLNARTFALQFDLMTCGRHLELEILKHHKMA